MNIFTKALAIAGLTAISSVATAGPIDLGDAGDYTMLAVGTATTGQAGGNLTLGAEAEIFGNVGARKYLAMGSGVKVHGDANGGYINAGPSVVIDGNRNELSESTWLGLYNDIANASAEAAALSGRDYSSVTTTTIFEAYDTTSVFNIDGELLLSSGEALTLSGNTDSMAIVNINGNFKLGSGASVLLDGFQADNVLFNFTGDGKTTLVDFGGSALSGTFIGADIFFSMGDGAILEDARFLTGGSIANVQVVKPSEAVTPTAVPAPASILLMLMGLVGLTLARRKTAK